MYVVKLKQTQPEFSVSYIDVNPDEIINWNTREKYKLSNNQLQLSNMKPNSDLLVLAKKQGHWNQLTHIKQII